MSKNIKKVLIASLGLIVAGGLAGCGSKSASKKSASTKPKTMKVTKVNQGVKTLQKKDAKLAKVSFNKKNGQVTFCVNNKNKIRQAQQTSAKQVTWLEKKSKDNNLQPKVVMKQQKAKAKQVNKTNKNTKPMKNNKNNKKQNKQMPKQNKKNQNNKKNK